VIVISRTADPKPTGPHIYKGSNRGVLFILTAVLNKRFMQITRKEGVRVIISNPISRIIVNDLCAVFSPT
jgi:hypothetical protein